MNEPFSFGAPERRRFAMQFGYDMRPSFWQGVRTNSHLVIAAVGTAALLGVAGIALWLALPANDRQAIASTRAERSDHSGQNNEDCPCRPRTRRLPRQRAAGRAQGDAVSPTVAAREAAIPALAANDPRWTGAAIEQRPPAAATPPPIRRRPSRPTTTPSRRMRPLRGTGSAKRCNDAAVQGRRTGRRCDGRHTDGAQTAAIPDAKAASCGSGPERKLTRPGQATESGSAAGTGRILRAVTMRAGPKQKAAAMVTVPAKTSVQVMSCKKWCQIVYNGKRGWIYKSYIKTGA